MSGNYLRMVSMGLLATALWLPSTMGVAQNAAPGAIVDGSGTGSANGRIALPYGSPQQTTTNSPVTPTSLLIDDDNDTDVVITLPDSPPVIKLDEAALYEAAASGNLEAVDREIEKLRVLDPTYQPPADLFTRPRDPEPKDDGPQVDEAYLWAAYNDGDFTAVRDEIAILQRLNPGWQPSDELVRLMDAQETRTYLQQATESQDWQGIVRYHKNNPGRFLCSDITIESNWLAADGYAKAGDIQGAYGIYRSLMEDCDDTDLRLSTLQKALANRNNELIAPLFELESSKGHSTSEEQRFAAIEKDWKGDPVADAAARRRAAYGRLIDRVSSEDATEEDVAKLETETDRLKSADGALVLGWYYQNSENSETAEAWFTKSMQWQPGEKAAEGLAATLMSQGRHDEAAQIAEAWRHRAEGMNDVLRGTKEQKVWADINAGRFTDALALISELQRDQELDPDLEMARGWALQGLDRPVESAVQFRDVLDEARGSTLLEQQAAYGLASSYLQSGFASDARGVMDAYPLPTDRRVELEQALAELDIAIAFDSRNYNGTLAAIDAYRSRWDNTSRLSTVEGWSLYHIGRNREAHAIFESMYANGQTREGAEGLKATQARLRPYDG